MEISTGNETTDQLWEECSPEKKLLFLISGVTLSVCEVLGILGNVASVIILVQPSMRSSTSILLVAMAVYDTLLLTTSILQLASYINHILNEYWYFSYLVTMICYCIGEITLTGTIYTTVVVTIERAVVVVFPLKAKLVCTKTRASVACGVVFLWSLIYSVPPLILYGEDYDYMRKETSHQDFRNGYFNKYVYLLYLNTVFHGVLPVGVIVILNIAIIKRLCMRGRRIIHQVSSRGNNQTQLTVMIIVLTGIFCASRLIFIAAIYLRHREQSEHEQSERKNITDEKLVNKCVPTTTIVSIAIEMIIIVNSATNFIVYSIFGQKFRRCLHALCCSRHCLQAHRSPSETQTRSGNKLSTSDSSLHLNILQDRQRSNSPCRSSALLTVPETGC